jgi:hypothetical protein
LNLFRLGRLSLGVALCISGSLSFPRVAAAALLADDQALQALGQSDAWKGLLQYQKNILGFESSEVVGRSFFMAKDGPTDSVSELKATLLALQSSKLTDPGDSKYSHPICVFPARFQFLLEKLHLKRSDFPSPACKDYEDFRSKVRTNRVGVVFSSYYAGNASSIFGHSFLRFSGTNENELFDTGINFSANPTTENPALYAIYGLTGVFPATFSAQAFYYKVREYNDFESRDLWTYDLNLSEDEKNFLLAHIWELGNSYYDYYYFNQNCSYHILRAIEGAIPRVHFWSHRPLDVIPSETIKLLNRVPGLVNSISYRPSIRSKAFYRYSQLGEEEKQALLKSLQTQALPEGKMATDAQVLDTLMDAFDLKSEKSSNTETEYRDAVLGKRAALPEVSDELHVPPPWEESPEKGHGSKRAVVSYGSDYLDLEMRASHHDLLDPSLGYPEFLHIDLGKAALRYRTDDRRLELKELDFVDLTALTIEHPLYSKLSYEGRMGMFRDPLDRPVWETRAGLGKAYPFLNENAFFVMLDVVPQYGSEFQASKYRITLEPNANLLLEFSPLTKMMVQGFLGVTSYGAAPLEGRAQIEFRHVFESTLGVGGAYAIGAQDAQHFDQWTLKLLYYF